MSGRLGKYSDYKDSGMDWIGRIPSEWDCRQLKYVAALSIQKATLEAAGTYVGMENISSGDGKYIGTSDMSPEGQSLKFQAGDVLFGKLRPYLAKSWLATFSGICSSEFLVLRTAQLEPKYLNYMLLSRDFITVVDSSTYGTKMPRASWDFIGMLKIPVPERALSEKIAKFLDYETAKIDALIAKQQQLIALLQEKRQAVISHAVTKGLNPAAPLRDSGVEWLGQVPAHWEAIRLKFLVSHVVDCHHSTPKYDPDAPWPALRTSDVFPGRLDVDGALRVNTVEYNERISRLKPAAGDVIYAREGRWGVAAPVPEGAEVCLAQRVMLCRGNHRMMSQFLMWGLNSQPIYHQLAVNVVGSASPHVNIGDVMEVWLAVPPLEEQAEIVAELERLLAKLDALDSQCERVIESLQERRTALIAAAVTGKIDVRGWQPPVANAAAGFDEPHGAKAAVLASDAG